MFLIVSDYLLKNTWQSNNPKVATVDTTGKVTGIAEGTTTITAKYSTYEDATYQINVKPARLGLTGIFIDDKNDIPQPSMIVNKEHSFYISLYNIPITEKERFM